MTRAEFINKFAPIVKKASAGTGLFASLFMAQAILESSDKNGVPGASSLSAKHNNFFGIKAQKNDGWTGKVVMKKTREVIKGKDVMVDAPFRAYDNAEQSFADRVAFLIRNRNYSKAGVFKATTPEEQADALQRAGYATDPDYAKTLKAMIAKYKLTTLDLTPTSPEER